MVPKFSIVSRLLSEWLIKLDEQEKESQQKYQKQVHGLVRDLGIGALNTKGISELLLLYIINSFQGKSGAVIELKGESPDLIASNNLDESHLKALLGLSGEAAYTFSGNSFTVSGSGKELINQLGVEPLFYLISRMKLKDIFG